MAKGARKRRNACCKLKNGPLRINNGPLRIKNGPLRKNHEMRHFAYKNTYILCILKPFLTFDQKKKMLKSDSGYDS